MRDLGAEATDKARGALEKRIRSVYREAQKDVQDKLDDFTLRFKVKDAMYQKQLKEGKITKAQYQQWLRGQVFQSDRWKQKLEQITTTLNESNKVAMGIINGEVNGIFAHNANWQSYTLEHSAGLNFGFEIYDSSTVARLLRDEPDLLPKRKVNVSKDKAWNRKKITRQITQGIIQGEPLDKIAKRLQKVTDMNRNSALTNAQTAMTGAQNAGRQESLNRAVKMGIQVKKEWLATLDGHTRTEHGQLDGQKVDVDKPFSIGGYVIAYPGDPHAHPAMIYNCRCTMISDLVKYPSKDAKRYDNINGKPIKDMTYTQWVKFKTKGSKNTSVHSLWGDVDKDFFAKNYRDALVESGLFANADVCTAVEEMDELISSGDMFNSMELIDILPEWMENDDKSRIVEIINSRNSGSPATPYSLAHKPSDKFPVEVYSKWKNLIQNNAGFIIDDNKIKSMLDSVYEYTDDRYLDIASASHQFGGVFANYSYSMSEKSKREAVTKYGNIKEFLSVSPKYEGTIYRGLGFDSGGEYDIGAWEDFLRTAKQGKIVEIPGISSWTSNRNVANQFASMKSGLDEEATTISKVIMVMNNPKSGVDISDLAEKSVKYQDEVLMPGGTKYRVNKVEKKEYRDGDGVKRIDMVIYVSEV